MCFQRHNTSLIGRKPCYLVSHSNADQKSCTRPPSTATNVYNTNLFPTTRTPTHTSYTIQWLPQLYILPRRSLTLGTIGSVAAWKLSASPGAHRALFQALEIIPVATRHQRCRDCLSDALHNEEKLYQRVKKYVSMYMYRNSTCNHYVRMCCYAISLRHCTEVVRVITCDNINSGAKYYTLTS